MRNQNAIEEESLLLREPLWSLSDIINLPHSLYCMQHEQDKYQPHQNFKQQRTVALPTSYCTAKIKPKLQIANFSG